MAEPFKNEFNEQIISGMARHFQIQWHAFDAEGFINSASKNLNSLELKQRSEQIMNAMIEYLPSDYSKAGEVILASLSPALEGDIYGITVDDKGIAGWATMPITHYVGVQGQDNFSLSMILLKELTKRFSSEFGIRFFLLNDTHKTMSTVKEWARDSNRHVRRLASEGTRPRLPWAMQLPQFIKDPTPVIKILEILKDDKDEYVRRSVANNLNDIAKDHPDVVTNIAAKWIKEASTERKKLVRHACRTLIKKGDKEILALFGYASPDIQQVCFDIPTPVVIFGNALHFTLSISSNANHDQPLIIDYVIYHRKSNGKLSPKVFKWRTMDLKAGEKISFSKKHAIKKITTRKYYQGMHSIKIMVNGEIVGKNDFQLLIPERL